MPIETLTFELTLLRSGLEAARVGICILDNQGTIVMVTDRFASAVGNQVDNLLGQHQRVLLTGGLQLHDFDKLFSLALA